MYPIIEARFLAENIKLFKILAPTIARKQEAGQFVIIRVDEYGERIPLTIADSDREAGTVTIIVQAVGKSTTQLNMLKSGDTVKDIVGPLGQPSRIEKYGTAVIIGGGVGTAIAYPTAAALKREGNYVISINGARSKNLIILSDEMKACSDECYITTDDGSYGFHGLVSDKLKQLIDQDVRLDFVLAIGPIPMMQAVAEITRPLGIKTMVSLNPIMVDGTGMCGGCRVVIGNTTKFACVDGPEFDAHQVDFKNLLARNRMYREFEQESFIKFRHECKLITTGRLNG